MQFNSVDFLIFFPIVVAVYFVIPKKLRMYWLLIASYYFYMSWNAWYAILIGGSTVITYVSARLFARFSRDDSDTWKRRVTMIVCLAVNLGILIVFKYGNFGIESVNWLLSRGGGDFPL